MDTRRIVETVVGVVLGLGALYAVSNFITPDDQNQDTTKEPDKEETNVADDAPVEEAGAESVETNEPNAETTDTPVAEAAPVEEASSSTADQQSVFTENANTQEVQTPQFTVIDNTQNN
jgi:hypothetical protein